MKHSIPSHILFRLLLGLGCLSLSVGGVLALSACRSPQIKMHQDSKKQVWIKEKQQEQFSQHLRVLPSKLISIERVVDFSIPSSVHRLEVNSALPRTLPFRQKVLSIRLSQLPHNVFEDHGSRYMDFVFWSPPSHLKLKVSMQLRLWRYDLQRIRWYQQHLPHLWKAQSQNLFRKYRHLSPAQRARYLRSERYIQSDHPKMRALVEKFKGFDELERLDKIFSFVKGRLSYAGLIAEDMGALRVYREKKADCDGYSDLLLALTRASGLPSRFVYGMISTFRRANGGTPRHAWVEVYLREYGWVPLDPLHADQDNVGFEKLENKYIYLSHKRQDFYASSYLWWSRTGASIRRKEKFRFHEKTTPSLAHSTRKKP